ncbi:hypothetical protein ACFSM5_11150 [Lacibacterium aquatile]|uniref:Cytidyltransferase-like domain-containing protein n=1 Tax=Lacibacterium aquatile TaxID=1168082 RepID=A0ABW5DTZ8_9PROT
MNILKRYLQSRSTRLALAMGGVMYLAYAISLSAQANLALIAVCLFVSAFLPFYSRLSNRAEELVNLRFAVVTLGRLARFGLQFAFNAAIFTIFAIGDVLPAETPLAHLIGLMVVTTLASQGFQYVGIVAYNRGFGDLNRNILVALSFNILLTAMAAAGFPIARTAFYILGIGFGALVFGVGILSDLRARFCPQGGVGVFFGTFNPFHGTHLQLVREALEQRGLSKIIIHPTIVPRLHATALERGEIQISGNVGGLIVYERTDKADANVNYFPTGNRFYAPEMRRLMIEAAIDEAGLTERVEVIWEPELYRDKGFYGVLDAIKRRHPGQRLHGIHGSDLGGMWVRSIYDECGWLYPYAVRRVDGVSATAIRNGAIEMATPAVRAVLEQLKAGRDINQASDHIGEAA